MHEPVGAEQNTRCHRCGGALGMGTTMLYRWEADHADHLANDPVRMLESLRRQLGRRRPVSDHPLKRLRRRLKWIPKGRFSSFHLRQWTDDANSFCQRCGTHSSLESTIPYDSITDNFPQRLLSRLRLSLARRRTPFEDAGRQADLSLLLARIGFPVYGIEGGPLGMRLREVEFGRRGRGYGVGRVSFLYVGVDPSVPRRALTLRQGVGASLESTENRFAAELQAIICLVMSDGGDDLRKEYLGKGNIHRDWNLERIGRTPRRRLSLVANGKPVEVDLAFWWEPEPVTLAHLAPEGHAILATSIGVSHVKMLGLLKTMVTLQSAPETLKEHRKNTGRRTGMPAGTAPAMSEAERSQTDLEPLRRFGFTSLTCSTSPPGNRKATPQSTI